MLLPVWFYRPKKHVGKKAAVSDFLGFFGLYEFFCSLFSKFSGFLWLFRIFEICWNLFSEFSYILCNLGLFGFLRLSGSFGISPNLSEFLGLLKRDFWEFLKLYGIFARFFFEKFRGFSAKLPLRFWGFSWIFGDVWDVLRIFTWFWGILQNFLGFLGFFGIYWDFPGWFLRIFQIFLGFLGFIKIFYGFLGLFVIFPDFRDISDYCLKNFEFLESNAFFLESSAFFSFITYNKNAYPCL